SWERGRAAVAWVLLPDLGTVPLRAWRRPLDRFLTWYALAHGSAALEGTAESALPPPLLILASAGGRQGAWRRLVDEWHETRGYGGDSSGATQVATWEELAGGFVDRVLVPVGEAGGEAPPPPPRPVRRVWALPRAE